MTSAPGPQDQSDDIRRLRNESRYKLVRSWETSCQSILSLSCFNSFLSPTLLLAGSDKSVTVFDMAVGTFPCYPCTQSGSAAAVTIVLSVCICGPTHAMSVTLTKFLSLHALVGGARSSGESHSRRRRETRAPGGIPNRKLTSVAVYRVVGCVPHVIPGTACTVVLLLLGC